MARVLCDFLSRQVEEAGASYMKDLNSMSHEQLISTAGGKARSPYDFTYEVAYVNGRVASRIRGEDPGPWPFESWVTAPETHREKSAAIAYLESSISELKEAFAKIDDAALEGNFETPQGPRKLIEIAAVPGFHMGYHDGQLNLYQAMFGDEQVHWD